MMTDKAKLSFNFVGAGADVPQRTTLLIRDTALRLHQSGLSDHTLEVDRGRYYVSTRTPDGDEQVLAGPIEVPAGGSLSLDLPAEALQQSGQRVVATLPRGDQKLPADAAAATASPTVRVARWQGRWLSHWTEQATQDQAPVLVPKMRKVYTLDAAQAILPASNNSRARRNFRNELLLAMDEGGTEVMTFFAVPFDGPVSESRRRSTHVTITRRAHTPTTEQSDRYDLAFAFDDPEVTRFLEYVREGLVREASTYSRDAVEAARSELLAKHRSPLGAVIGTYVLLRANALDGLDAATANLMSLAPDLPDVLPLRVEYLARTARHGEAVAALQRAHEFGCPWFRSGLFYLLSRAKRYLSADAASTLGIASRTRVEIAMFAGGLEALSAYLDPNRTVATYRDVPVQNTSTG